jgi:predicted metal-dependent peptidase
MSFDKLTPNQRIQAVNIDCMRHPKFALLSGVICMGKSEVSASVPTACTDGQNKLYGADFIEGMTRKQLRYLVLHENFHVALKHCVLPYYANLFKQFRRTANMAADYVVNATIEELDPNFTFVERPTKVKPLIDPRFTGMSFPQVLKALLEDEKDKPQDESGEGQPGEPGDGDGCMDEHQMSSEDMPVEAREKLEKMIDDANRQGELLSRKMRGNEAGGRDILGTMQDRTTNWREALIDFLNDVCKGDENSRFSPPNRRMLASGFLMPSHFDERVGEIVIACDTSGSMHWAYPIVFGEVARVCQHAKPEKVRMLWWDTEVAGDQSFLPDDYDKIANVLAPKGGGGTTVACVAQYMADKRIKPKAVIMLTDGYIEDDYQLPDVPVLWGAVNNDTFTPKRGKVLRINP